MYMYIAIEGLMFCLSFIITELFIIIIITITTTIIIIIMYTVHVSFFLFFLPYSSPLPIETRVYSFDAETEAELES